MWSGKILLEFVAQGENTVTASDLPGAFAHSDQHNLDKGALLSCQNSLRCVSRRSFVVTKPRIVPLRIIDEWNLHVFCCVVKKNRGFS